MAVRTYLYPWDVVGDPTAPARIAGLGVDAVVLAAAYHATRALTPHHPVHRVLDVPYAAAYYQTDEDLWRGRRLRPAPATWLAAHDPFGTATAALHARGLAVHAWLVLTHNARIGSQNPDVAVRNAYGDRYPWALCIAQPAVREYASTLAAEVAAREDVDGLELEACGWYGIEHQGAHDKTGGVPLGDAERFLLSLCFCSRCRANYAGVGLDPHELCVEVRAQLDKTFRGDGAPKPTGWPGVTALLGAETAANVLQMRRVVGDQLRTEVIAAVRKAGDPARSLRVLLHADPEPYRCGASVGVDAQTALTAADGLVINCWGDLSAATTAVRQVAAAAAEGQHVVANLLAIAGIGGDPNGLPARIAAACQAGAGELSLYHAGLASPSDLNRMRSLITAFREGDRP